MTATILLCEYGSTAHGTDNPNVIAMWTAEGIPTTIIPGWDDQ